MKKTIKILILLLVMCSTTDVFSGGDPHFSQFYSSYLYLNPAFAGSAICPRIILNYRNQMPTLTGTNNPFSTYNVSYDAFIRSASGGLGIMATADNEANTIRTQAISGIYSYRLPLNRDFTLNVGFQFSYLMKQLDASNLHLGSEFGGSKVGYIKKPTSIANTSSNIQDFSIGFLGFTEKYYCGLAVHHLTQPNVSLGGYGKSPIYRKITLHGGAIFDFKSDMNRGGRMNRRATDPTISPNLIFISQGALNSLSYGAYINKYPIVLGTWVRQSFTQFSNIIVLVGVHKGAFKFGYSIDIPLVSVGMISGGANEVSCTYKLPCRPQKKKIRAINCPTF